MKIIAAVVVTFNRKALLIKNIESLFLQTRYDVLDIIIIDNASTDGTREALSEYIIKNKIIYKNTGYNLGGAGGFNFGVKYAAELGYKYLWLMDDDTIPKANCLENLICAAKELNYKFGFLASNVLWKDDSVCLMNRQKFYNKTIDPNNYENNLIQVTQASFVSIFFSVQIVQKVGLPIKDFFIWGDDVEYTRRIGINYKIPCYMVKNSEVNHYMAVNIGSNIAVDISERISRYRFAYRNEFYIFRREGTKGLVYYFAKCLFNLLRIIASNNKEKIHRIRVLYNAVIEGYRFRPKIEYLTERKIKQCTPPPRLTYRMRRIEAAA